MGGMINSTIHALILVPVFFLMKRSVLRRGTLTKQPAAEQRVNIGSDRTALDS